MCDRLKTLNDVGEDRFWDTTGNVTSGKIDGIDYLYYQESDPNLIADDGKLCILDVVKGSLILGDGCFNCAKRIFLRRKSQIPLTDTPE